MARSIFLLIGILLCACGPTAKGDRRAFLIAAENGDVHIVKSELENGVRPDDVFQINDRTALCLAAINGHPEVVDLLLKQGADVTLTHLGASMKMEVQAHWGHLKDAHAKPDSTTMYTKVDGTKVPMKSLRLSDDKYERVVKLLDDALARAKK
jgi:ankyrin repeat protein